MIILFTCLLFLLFTVIRLFFYDLIFYLIFGTEVVDFIYMKISVKKNEGNITYLNLIVYAYLSNIVV